MTRAGSGPPPPLYASSSATQPQSATELPPPTSAPTTRSLHRTQAPVPTPSAPSALQTPSYSPSGASSPSVRSPTSSPRPIARLSNLFVTHTKKTCAVALLFPLLCIAVIALTRAFALDDPQAEDYLVRDDIRTRLEDARAAARATFRFALPAAADSTGLPPPPTQRVARRTYALDVLVRGKTAGGAIASADDFAGAENVVSARAFALMKAAEDVLLNDRRYTSFCLRDLNALGCDNRPVECRLPLSPLNDALLYGEPSPDGRRICARRQGNAPIPRQRVEQFVSRITSNEDTRFPFFSNDFSRRSRSAWAARALFPIGLPFPGFSGIDDRASEQLTLYVDWATEIRKRILALSTTDFDVFITGSELSNSLFSEIALRDMVFAIAALVLVFLVMWLHTASAFLAGVALLQMFLSFPLTFFVYHFLFRQLYFSSLQILAIFLLLGIGADDVFVFTDAWKQAAVVLGAEVSIVSRMEWTYRRAVRAMTVTSVTTAAAFFVTATNPIMPIGTLGIWAGLLILLQFFLVITVYPCAIIIWHRFWRGRSILRCMRKPMVEDATTAASKMPPDSPDEGGTGAQVDTVVEYRLLERMLRGPWASLVYYLRFAILLFAVALVGVSTWLATSLQPPQSEEVFFPSWHPVPIAVDALQHGFPRSNAALQLNVRVTWGIRDVDRTGTTRFAPDELGKPVMDTEFDLTSRAAQQHVLDTCEFFEKQAKLLFNGSTGIEPVRCWIRQFAKWRRTELGAAAFETYRSGREQVSQLLNFSTWKEENGTQPFLKFFEEQDIAVSNDQTRVVFTEVRFVSNTEVVAPYQIMWPVYNTWQDSLGELNAKAPRGMERAIATGGFPWQMQITQVTLIRAMFIGICVMLGVALVALTAVTLNWAVSILATLCIGGIIAMLLGSIRLLGWSLGVTETVAVVICIGYSFDGVAHVATAYVESRSKSRFDRTRDALTDLGISIVFGAVSTLSAGFMLFPATVTFFRKFGALIVLTVSLSTVWSLALFTALLMIAGPLNSFGSLGPAMRRLFCCFPAPHDKTKEQAKSNSNAHQHWELDAESGSPLP